MTDNLFILLRALIAICGVLVTAKLVPWLKVKLGSEKTAELLEWVRIAVTAAEQIFTGSGKGKEKKAYVVAWLESHGITVEESKLDAMIESVVYEMNSSIATLATAETAFAEAEGVGENGNG